MVCSCSCHDFMPSCTENHIQNVKVAFNMWSHMRWVNLSALISVSFLNALLTYFHDMCSSFSF
ncbi:hypothetical protein SLEP1_g9495 [Rubroshorea leprosula]|uniref:Uncharacterized protein n=1 Tax=Rubroshorea leprosula TaxID=152421 RepID=A0AAV5IAT3_9ROSI|nr:hypothetical protein SLEP1_g9495 [Rubroshorea leprosula]